jgi:hypothetical protein
MSTITVAEPASSGTASRDGGGPRLRPHALGFPTLLAQSVALISPTMTAVLIIALAFGDSGQGTWAAYLFGTVMLLFVVLGLNQFARRSATAGSMYAYTARGLGPAAGVLSGWSLIWSYWGIATAGLAGFAIFAQQFLSGIGVHSHVTPVRVLRDQRLHVPDRSPGRTSVSRRCLTLALEATLGHLHPRAGGGRALQARALRRHRAGPAQGRQPQGHGLRDRHLHLQPGRVRERDDARERGQAAASQRATRGHLEPADHRRVHGLHELRRGLRDQAHGRLARHARRRRSPTSPRPTGSASSRCRWRSGRW